MDKIGRNIALFVLMLFASGLTGCASTDPRGQQVPITDLKSVAGPWTGILSRDSSDREDWVRVIINEDGTYEVSSFRQIGVLQGKGTIAVRDGKLMAESERGTSVYTLYEKDGNRRMKVNATTKSGVTYSADLKPAK